MRWAAQITVRDGLDGASRRPIADSGAPSRGQLAAVLCASIRLWRALPTSDGVATLCASQHSHVTGSAVALDDGQALVLD